ncbi:unannotated protein [freshwater metagenome]|uniref:Unannotated protein n=1 Tax=freshwater metagenome TaxID=449393 RepID=A0A6J6WID9_9ZZZZ
MLESSRASGAPRQWCIPNPNPRWGLGSRSRISAVGLAKTSGSRFALPMRMKTRLPLSSTAPGISMSSVKVRPVSWTGETMRKNSSVAVRSSSGRVRSCSWATGSCASARSEPEIKFMVVSCPATNNKMAVLNSSPSVSESSPSRAATSALSKSSPGLARRFAKRSWK